MTTLELDDKIVLETLRQIVDPELGCNIVDLGLIYDVQIDDAKVSVKMTLTSAGCPMQASIASGVQTALLGLEGVEEANVELVFDPPWNPAMMSEHGRSALGIYDS
jgi:metal-sulfur cluster biosynthetic enzyme